MESGNSERRPDETGWRHWRNTGKKVSFVACPGSECYNDLGGAGMKFAIYSRKSKTTDKGESIGNQVEMCKSYINANDPGEEHEFLIYDT